MNYYGHTDAHTRTVRKSEMHIIVAGGFSSTFQSAMQAFLLEHYARTHTHTHMHKYIYQTSILLAVVLKVTR